MPTNYEEYFGTPQKTADMIFLIKKCTDRQTRKNCWSCFLRIPCWSDTAICEWLESEVSDA